MTQALRPHVTCSVGIVVLLAAPQVSAQPRDAYAWRNAAQLSESLSARFAPPPGFEREALAPDSFGAWLRGLPLKPGRPPVRLYDGQLKNRQDVHVAVIDIDVGIHDLQQCADSVIRLRAEWLFASGRHAEVHFHTTSGDDLAWPRWAAGERPSVHGARIRWALRAAPDDSRASFRRYLDQVFTYAGTLSLERETASVPVDEMRIGDVFVQGGSPGHAVIVIDMARDAATGRRVFMLAQGYMPAQEIHVLRNPQRAALDPWYPLDFGEQLVTPEWTFTRRHLRRFRD
jgi:hypothetical protein